MLKHVTSRPGWDEKGVGAKGFTLVELLVVIVILGILAAVAVFAVGGITSRGQEAACGTEERSLKTAVEAYRAQNEILPATEAVLVPGFLEEEAQEFIYTYSDGGTPGNTQQQKADDSYSVDPVPDNAGGKCA